VRSTRVVLLGLCSSCAQLPYTDIPDAPPAQTGAVVFDIDGTLTPNVSAVFKARKDAAAAVRAYAYAYGDSSTDLAAYAAVEIRNEHVMCLFYKEEASPTVSRVLQWLAWAAGQNIWNLFPNR
jgi:hypothetical protein